MYWLLRNSLCWAILEGGIKEESFQSDPPVADICAWVVITRAKRPRIKAYFLLAIAVFVSLEIFDTDLPCYTNVEVKF
jgi:hypothetical protein